MAKNMSNEPLVSVITVVLNGEKTIERTIRSVLSQSYTNLEYLVLDGGSGDRTLEIIRRFEVDARLRWISEPDNGIADAWNKGINMSAGRIIGLINADDWYEKNAVEQIVEAWTGDAEIICGNVRLWNSPEKFSMKRSSLKGIRSQMTIWHPGMFCTREIYWKIGLYDAGLKVLMDYDFVIRSILRGAKFTFPDNTVANMSFGGLSNQMISKSMNEALAIKNKYFGRRFIHYFEYVFFQIYFHLIIHVKKMIYA